MLYFDTVHGLHGRGHFTEEEFNTLCRQIGLHHWTENGPIQLKDAFKVRKCDLTNSEQINEENVIGIFFRRLLSNDHRALTLFRNISDQEYDEGGSDTDAYYRNDTAMEQDLDEVALIIEYDEDSLNGSESTTSISCRDAIFAILHSCDPFLRHQLLSKMFSCQLAVPLILPKCVPDKGLILLLWEFFPLHKKFIEKGVVREECVATFPFPIVSFAKYGNSNIKKSEIINKILEMAQGDIKHPFFLTSSDDEGNVSTWSNGTVEAVWHTPISENIQLPATCFLNLRGPLDIENVSRQEHFLEKYSTCIIIFCAHSHVERLSERIQVNVTAKKVIIISISDQLKRKFSVKDHGQITCFCFREFNLHNISKEIFKTLLNVIKDNETERSLFKDGAHLCNECGIENSALLSVANQAEMTCMSICKQTSGDKGSEHYKKEVFKLEKSWKEWSRAFKDTTWQTSDVMKDLDRKDQKKLHIRKEQAETPLSPEIKAIVDKLEKGDTYELQHIFYWLNVFYNLRVRDTQIKLTGSMKLVRDKLHKLSHSNTSEVSNEGKEIAEREERNLVDRLSDNYLGISHIVREVGQIYESQLIVNPRMCTTDGKTFKFHDLPKTIAAMILKGHSFELFDGDACNVPIKWVQAVLNHLSVLTNNARMFTLSVLGMQSSGKSTLLNSMFGVQFPVSSGRCTRGISLQLLEVEVSLQEELGCKYIALIDTEGLGAPEKFTKGGSLLDNELATFAICLSDLTLINVRGEYVGQELSNILQIAAYAFMRMTTVELKSYCRIIQHSVNDIMAHQKNISVEKIILRELDEAVIKAAKQEGRSNEFSKFTDIFDLSHGSKDGCNIHYIPGFAQDNMAKYSESVLNLKQELLSWVKTNKVVSLSISDFAMQLQDIWLAIIQENFVFSFKSSIEVLAYTELKEIYRRHILECDQLLLIRELKYENRLRCMSPTDVRQGLDIIQTELTALLGNLSSKVMEKLCEYIQGNRYNLLKKYETDIYIDFEKYIDGYQRRLKENLENITKIVLQGNNKENAKFLEAKQKITSQLYESTSSLMATLETTKQTDIQKEDIDNVFEETWTYQIDDLYKTIVTPDRTELSIEVKSSIFEIIKGCCKSAENLIKFVREKLGSKDLCQYCIPMDGKTEHNIDKILDQLLTMQQHKAMSLLNNIGDAYRIEDTVLKKQVNEALFPEMYPGDKDTNEALFQEMYPRDNYAVNMLPKVVGDMLPSSSEFTTEIISINVPGDESENVVLNMRHVARDRSLRGKTPAVGTTDTNFPYIHLRPYHFEKADSFQRVVSCLGRLVEQYHHHDTTFNYYPTIVCLICWLCFEIQKKCQLAYLLQVLSNDECYCAVFGEPLLSITKVRDYISSLKGELLLNTNIKENADVSSPSSYDDVLNMYNAHISELDFPIKNLSQNYEDIAKELFSRIHVYLTANKFTMQCKSNDYGKIWEKLTNTFIDRLCRCHAQNVKKKWIDMVDANCHGILWNIRNIRDKVVLSLRNNVRYVPKMHPDPLSDTFTCDKRLSTMPWHIPEIQFLDRSLVENLKGVTHVCVGRILTLLAKRKKKFVQHLKARKKFDKHVFEMALKEIVQELMEGTIVSTEDIATSLVHFGAWALPLCVDAQVAYNKDHNVVNRIINQKDNFYEDFKSYTFNRHGGERQAKQVFSLLKNSLNKTIENKVLSTFHNTLVHLEEFSSREKFIYNVLFDMCEKANFFSYLHFIHDNKGLLEAYALQIIVDKCSSHDIACIDQEVFIYVDTLRKTVKESLRNAKDQVQHVDTDTSKQLIDIFIDILSEEELPCNKDNVTAVKQFIDIKDFSDFEEMLFKELDKLCDTVIKGHTAVNEFGTIGVTLWLYGLSRPLPQNMVSRLIGCDKHCPFCKVMCDQTVEHTMHSAAAHYPVGIGGFRDKTTSELGAEICTTFVSSHNFGFSQGGDRFLPFSLYRIKHPDWLIKPDLTGDANNYWKWVFRTFNKEFADMYKAKEADIPSGWLYITKDDAKECIRCIYKPSQDTA